MLTTPPDRLPLHETPVLFGTRTLPETNPRPEPTPIADPPQDLTDRCGCAGQLSLPPGWASDDPSCQSNQDLADPPTIPHRSDADSPQPPGAPDHPAMGAADSPVAAPPDRFCEDPPQPRGLLDWPAAGDESPDAALLLTDASVPVALERSCLDLPQPPDRSIVDEPEPSAAVLSGHVPETAWPEQARSEAQSDRLLVDSVRPPAIELASPVSVTASSDRNVLALPGRPAADSSGSSAIAVSIQSDRLSAEPLSRIPSAPTTSGHPQPEAAPLRLPILIPLACLSARFVIEAATRTAMLAPIALRTIRSRGALTPRRPYGAPPW